MFIKIYAFGWLLMLALIGTLFFAGAINELTLAVIGFAAATLVLAGPVALLPWWVDRQYTWHYRA
jgi:hypothetical protein